MYKPKPPCGKSCDNREFNCHSTCENWQNYVSKKREYNKQKHFVDHYTAVINRGGQR